MRPLKLWKVWQTLRLLEAEAILLPLNQLAVAMAGMQAMAMQAMAGMAVMMAGMAAMMAGMEEDMVAMMAVTVDTGKSHLFAFLLSSPAHAFPCRISPPGSSWSLSFFCLWSSSHCLIRSDPNDELLAAQAADDAAALNAASLDAAFIDSSAAIF